MDYDLMKVITESITRGVTTLPLKEISSEISKERGGKEVRYRYDEMLHSQYRKLR
jgi:hypothetical protein